MAHRSLDGDYDLLYLSYTRWWSSGGFQPTADIVSFGVTLDAIDNVGTYFQQAGFLLIALGFAFLAPTLAGLRSGWGWLAYLAWLEAVALVAWVLTGVAQTGTLHYIAAIAAGLFLGPLLAVLSGYALATGRVDQVHEGFAGENS